MKTNKNIEQDVRKSINAAREITNIMRDKELTMVVEECPNLQDVVANNSHASTLIDNISDSTNYIIDTETKEDDINKLIHKLNRQRSITRRKQMALWICSSAAACVTIALLLLYPKTQLEPIIISMVNNESTITTPTLLLSSGEDLNLNAKSVIETKVYDDEQSKKIDTGILEPKYNTIVVPHNYTLNVVLADGTKVYLNANSELKYPVEFSADQREVFLKGEALFEVKKDSKPFIVSANDVLVRVYGTRFNINASTKQRTETILLSGSVGITNTSSKESDEIMLTPNHKCVLDTQNNKTSIEKIDPDISVLWIDGYFACHDQPLNTLFDQLSRWYGVAFIVNGHIDMSERMTISLSRDLTIEEILDIINSTIGVKITKSDSKTYNVEPLK